MTDQFNHLQGNGYLVQFQIQEKKLEDPSKPSKTILADLEQIDLPQDIKIHANDIFLQMDIGTRKKNKRKFLILFCIDQVYLKKNIPCDPKILAKLIGIDPRKINKVVTYYPQIQTGYQPISRHFTPIDFIPRYYRLSDLSPESYHELFSLASCLLQNHTLNNKYPPLVATAVIKYFMEINGKKCPPQFLDQVSQTESSLAATCKLVAKIHNSHR